MRVRVICGPTGGGKSRLALRLAERRGAAIISADSRQIYTGFDIGTAKPSVEDRERVQHFGIDVADPDTRYSAAKWAAGAREWISGAIGDGKTPLVVGGTGLYIKALFEPLADAPPLDEARRGDLAAFLAERDLATLREWCRAMDRPRAHLGRTQLLRSIETALLAGERLSDVHANDRDSVATRPALTPVYLLLDPMLTLHSRISARFERMLDDGWLDEVRGLDASLGESAPAWKASGYGVLREVVRGETDLAAAKEKILIETRQYAKRQRTWFRHQLPRESVTRLNPDAPGSEFFADLWWNAGAAASPAPDAEARAQ